MKVLLSIISMSFALGLSAQREVSQEVMTSVYEEVKTPYKYGLAVAPADNYHKIDCPTVFREGDKWYMTYVVYNGKGGTDGRGYETHIAESDDLLEWTSKGNILSYRDGYWDCNQRGGFPALPDMEWGGSYTLQKYKSKYWMTYIGGEGTGYEAVKAPLFVGLAWTGNKAGEAQEWESLDKPILSIHDKDAQWWELMTQYKSTVYWDKSKTLGSPFVMFYNAGGRHPETGLKGERVGIALSKDMKKWKRYDGNPVYAHEAEGIITGDAHIQKIDDLYVMFYFGAFEPSRTYKAYNTFAASYDLVNWTDWKGQDLIIPSKPYDELFAHKSYVVKHDGVVYHFYCAVNNAEQRGIAVATSKPMGQSKLNFPKPETKNRREITGLDNNWKTWLTGVENTDTLNVNIPHNWDDYYGYRQLTHGNLHGNAVYNKEFNTTKKEGKRYFLRFDGVGTYAVINLNGKDLGRHPVGRTTLTLDVTESLINGKNSLCVVAEHPEMIADMPWVCGGCSSEWGFSEGSQPLGIFRPVVLEATNEVRIEPFGVHIWNDDNAQNVYIDTEIKNYGSTTQSFELVNKFSNSDGKQVFRLTEKVTLKAGETAIIRQQSKVDNPIRWSTENPYLYKLSSMIKSEGKTVDEIATSFGIRTISWPVKRNNGDQRFFLNDKPVFINGVCEYEHQFGQSHAFSKEQVKARVKQMLAAGFNAFRDAHQPHHLDYQEYWDKEGILFWTQLSAHVWYDTPEFRENFKTMLRRWVKERRNSPSVVIWGLQNESTLPREFAKECSDIIREMDPTANKMRIITTCNGGDGTDWNVIQNWSGTYGGNLYNYDKELSRPDQLLNGEYGAWRSLGLHTEPGDFQQNGLWSEGRMCQLMEAKIRLAESAKDSVCGQFQWIYSSHDNPGRRQPDEAHRHIDKVGPFNYKGLVSPWEEPLDVYYMYKANYIPASKEPMVYLVSHTWPDRFIKGERRAHIEAYSNCDSVILYNDATDNMSLGVKRNKGIGTHFNWEKRIIKYNVLRAVGYYGGKPVAEDVIVLNGLEKAPGFDALYSGSSIVPSAADNYAATVQRSSELALKHDLKGDDKYDYLYRVNCGGDNYTDSFGQTWTQDTNEYSRSWAEQFIANGDTLLSPYQASQRVTFDPIRGTRDWTLFQSFRFGRHKLYYEFPVVDGDYRIELYFTEPWHGTGASAQTDCEALRLFDVAVNNTTVISNLDIWAETGHDGACKKVVYAKAENGMIKIHFPEVKAGQALISGIAVAAVKGSTAAVKVSLSDDKRSCKILSSQNGFSWIAQEALVMEKTPKEMLPEDKNARLQVSYQAEDAHIKGRFSKKEVRKQNGVFFSVGNKNSITWDISTGLAQIYALRFKYMNTSGKPIKARMQLIDSKGGILKDDELTFAEAPEKWRMVSTTTGGFINAGYYKIVISGENINGLAFDALDVQ